MIERMSAKKICPVNESLDSFNFMLNALKFSNFVYNLAKVMLFCDLSKRYGAFLPFGACKSTNAYKNS